MFVAAHEPEVGGDADLRNDPQTRAIFAQITQNAVENDFGPVRRDCRAFEEPPPVAATAIRPALGQLGGNGFEQHHNLVSFWNRQSPEDKGVASNVPRKGEGPTNKKTRLAAGLLSASGNAVARQGQ